MKISKLNKKTKGHRASNRNITEIEKAIAVIKKFNKDERNEGALRVFISSGTVVVKRSDDFDARVEGYSGSRIVSKWLGNHFASNISQGFVGSEDSSKKMNEVKARYAAIQDIINASNSETEKAVLTLTRTQTDEEKDFYNSLKSKLIHR